MIAIVDYGLGNVGSIRNMLKKIGAPAIITGEPKDIEKATKLMLPGVGTFDDGMKNLQDRGLLPVLNSMVLEQRVPILGVCLGMQLLSRGSEEGILPGLGWLRAETIRFNFGLHEGGFKVPHMGWNEVVSKRASVLLAGLKNARFYFVHSYHVVCSDAEDVVATCRHGVEFAAVVERNNIFGAQFHPEKSHRFGMQLLRNFAALEV